MFWTTYVHNSIANSNSTVIKICILKLFTCTAATRRPRMTTSDFMMDQNSVTLATNKANLKLYVPTSIWNLRLIMMWLYHFKRKIRLRIQTPFITNLLVIIFKSLGNWIVASYKHDNMSLKEAIRKVVLSQ